MKNQSRRLPFQKWDYGGLLKLPLFKDMAVSRRYRYVLITYYQIACVAKEITQTIFIIAPLSWEGRG